MSNKIKSPSMGKFNNTQKKAILIGLLIISAAVSIWIGFGAEVFTKSQVLIDKNDELLGTSYKGWKNQFVLGLDYTLAFIGFTTIVIVMIVWQLGAKKRTKNSL
ncbi:MAG: hypothetical protein KGZ42_05830 [Melioribacter sp.]|nr:hypothetical protein [Melioribacter sp.]